MWLFYINSSLKIKQQYSPKIRVLRCWVDFLILTIIIRDVKNTVIQKLDKNLITLVTT